MVRQGVLCARSAVLAHVLAPCFEACCKLPRADVAYRSWRRGKRREP